MEYLTAGIEKRKWAGTVQLRAETPASQEGGNTQAYSNVIAKRRVSALILLQSSALMEQWQEALEKFLHIDEELPEYETPAGHKKRRKSIIGKLQGHMIPLQNIFSVIIYDYVDSHIPCLTGCTIKGSRRTNRSDTISFPGPDHYIDMEKLAAGKVRARRYRNPKIGEFFNEIDLSEKKSTGISKILRELERNGSPMPELKPINYPKDNGHSCVSEIWIQFVT